MEINFTILEEALKILGELLDDQGHHYEIVAIGGGSLLLLGLMERTTRDLDLVALIQEGQFIPAEPLPQPLLLTIKKVGIALDLGENWLDTRPQFCELPSDFMSRLHVRRYKGLTVYLANRLDQICFKLFATVDQGLESKHYIDLINLKPTAEELAFAKSWCITQDVSHPFEAQINETLENIHVS